MSFALFFLLASLTAAIISLPLLPLELAPDRPRRPAQEGGRARRSVSPVTDEQIDQAVLALRTKTGMSGSAATLRGVQPGPVPCPACGRPSHPDDRFCVHCGAPLLEAAPAAPLCPLCGASLHEGDLFCPKCGRVLAEARGQ